MKIMQDTLFDQMIGSSNCWCSIEGQFKCYLAQIGVGGVKFSGEKRYEGVVCNVISITRGWVGVQFPGKKRYITLERSLTAFNHQFINGPCSQQVDMHKEGGQ